MAKIETLQGKLDKAQARQDELKADLETVKVKIDELQGSLGAAVYAGGDPDKLQAEITKLTKRSEALSLAIEKARRVVRDQAQALAKAKAEEAGKDLAALNDDGLRLLVEFYRHIYQAQEAQEKAREIRKQMIGVCNEHGLRDNEYRFTSPFTALAYCESERVILLKRFGQAHPDLYAEAIK